MKSRELLMAGILSVQAVCGLAEKQQPQLKVNQILDAKPKEIGARYGQGGLRNLIDSGFLQPVDGSNKNKARRLGALKGHHTAPENFETKRTETLKGKPKTKNQGNHDIGAR
jgi:hypothetical protein